MTTSIKTLVCLFAILTGTFHLLHAQLPAYVPSSGLLAYYGFNNNANDLSGNGVTGIVSSVSYSNDRFGNPYAAALFLGSGERITTKTINRTAVNNLSYSVWAYPGNSATIPSQGSNLGLTGPASSTCVIAAVDGWAWASGSHVGVGLNVATNGVYVVEHGPGITNVSLSWSGTLTGWHHIVVVYISRQPFLYVDGSFVQAGVTSSYTVHPSMGCDSFAFGPGSYPYLTAGFGHGLYPITVPSYNFTGLIDDIAIYGRSLNNCEISRLYDTTTLPITISGTTSVCAGSTTALSSPYTGGRWTSSNTGVATVDTGMGLVTGITGGTANITYTLGTGCYASTIVTVSPFPPITGIAAICTGGTTTFSNSMTGGTWTSSSTVATINPGSGLATGLTPGTTTISYTITSGCARTVVLTVNPLPNAITGNTTICPGLTSLLIDLGGGTWSSSNLPVAIVGLSSGIVSALSTGSSTITYKLSTGCFTTTTVYVSPFSTPITGAGNVCLGLPIAMSNAVPGGSWSSSNVPVLPINPITGIGLGNTAGTATITYSFGPGCFGTKAVTVDPTAPITGPGSVCAGQTITLSNAISGGVWSSSNSAVATVTGGIVSGISPGTSTISYVLPSGCIQSLVILVNPRSTSVITGGTVLCQGLSSILSNGISGGTWSSSSPPIASIGVVSGVLGGISSGTAAITYTTILGCQSITTITVNPLPAAITGVGKICDGATATFSDDTAGGAWTSSNSLIATIGGGSGIATGIAPGTTTLTYTLPTGCIATSKLTVNPLPAPITGSTSLCAGHTSALSTTTGGGLWTSGNVPVASVTSGLVSGTTVGVAVITYKIVATGCLATSTITVTTPPAPISGVSNICQGNTATLSNSVPGGTWYSSNSSIATIDVTTGDLTGVLKGTATITYSLGVACLVTTAETVNPLAPITGAANICSGKSTVFSDAATGGTWSSSNISVATVGSTSGTVLGLSAGTATIVYLLPTGCSASKVITINALPPAVTGTMAVCAGLGTTLSNAAIGGAWSTSNSAIATIDPATGYMTGVLKGTATITYSLGSGCITSTAVTVNPLPPAITGPSNVCAGSTITLTDAVTGGTWTSVTSSAVIHLITGVVTGVAAGTTTITYTLSTGCITTRIINTDPLPAAITGIMHVCEGFATTLSNATPGGAWSSAGTAVTIGAGSGITTGISAATATISYTSTSGCTTTTTFTVNATPAVITGAPAVCEGAAVKLSDTTPGGKWSSNNTAIATIDSNTGTVNGTYRGTAGITYTLATGCKVDRAITVNPVAAITGPAIVCPSKTIALTNAVSGGTWSSDSITVATVSSGGIVTGVLTGASVISYVLPTGCSSASRVTVSSWRSPGVITGVTTLCRGYQVTLFDTATGGVWGSIDPNVYVDTALGTVRGIAPGTATITYGVTNSCGTTVATHTVTVIPSPTARVTSGPDSVCLGAAISLSASMPAGLWTSVNTIIAVNSTSGMVTGMAAGSSTVTYTFINICGLTTEYHGVKVNSLPKVGPITGTTNVCVGAITLLGNAEPGGTWMATNGNATIAAGVATGITAGNDTIIYTITTACGVADTSVAITINPKPDAGTISGAGSMCPGLTTTLTNIISGGIWSSSGVAGIGATTGIVTGTTVGTAAITYQVTNICGAAKATTLFTIDPLPDAGAITGADNVCAGQTITLAATIAGGTWSNGNTAIDTVSNGVITGITAGTDTVVYSITNVCGTAIVKHGFAVNPLPTAGTITGNNELCMGTTIWLSDDIAGGVWSSSDVNLYIDNGNVTGMFVGTGVISYSVTNMCGVATTAKTITVTPLPAVAVIKGAAVVCEGLTLSLTDDAAGGVWSSNNDVATIADGTVTAVRAGMDTIVYRITNSCGTITTSKAITINPQPYAGVITVADSACVGDTIMLSSNAAGGVWNLTGNQVVRLIQPAGIACVAKGQDTVSYTVTNTCGVALASYPIKIRSTAECYPDTTAHHNHTTVYDCTGNSELMIYPNPNPGVFTINVISDVKEEVTVSAFNMLGQKIFLHTMMTNSPMEINLNQPTGMYIVSVNGAHGHCSKKLTVNK